MKQHTYIATLQEELRVLKLLISQQEALRKELFARNWEQLDGCLQEIELLVKDIERVEAQRNGSYKELCRDLGVKEVFSEFCSKLGEPHRREVNTLYREMKIAVLHFKCISQQIDSYARELKLSSEDMMEAYFPALKDKRYSATGSYFSNRYHALVCDWST